MIQEMMNTIKEAENYSITENGAVGYKSTGSNLVDLNFRIPSMRGGLSDTDINDFKCALNNDLEYAVKWMFYVRDVRCGLGERDSFVSLYKIFYDVHREKATNCLSLIAEYGRWKDLVDLCVGCDKNLEKECMSIICEQLKSDIYGCINEKPISLLAKWLPSINASKKARVRARAIAKNLDMDFCDYRKMLSKLRKYLDVTEVKTCANKWNEIDYNKVSSNANLKYKDAFIKHDEERRLEYLDKLSSPKNTEVKMNASVLYPHEIWAKCVKYNDFYEAFIDVDPALEAMWNNLKDMGSCGNTLCVVDGSGSMEGKCNGIVPIHVARSLGVYFAERCTGEFHNKMIEFSSRPQIINIDDCDTLCSKVKRMYEFDDCSNTNIEATFMLILNTAIKNNMSQSDMPENILIVSDMEFDHATYGSVSVTLFDSIKERFERYGYKMPKLIFWNVSSRTNTIPVKENELGVTLVSGYSVNILKMVMSGETDPWFALKSILDDKRYSPISDKLKSVTNG